MDALVLLALIGQGALSQVFAGRIPINAAGDQLLAEEPPGSFVQLNAARDVVTTADGVQSVTSVEADGSQGTVRSYVARTQTMPLVISEFEPDVGVVGGFIVEAFVDGPPQETVDITIELSFDGELLSIIGQPFLFVAPTIFVVAGSPIDPFAPSYSLTNTTGIGVQTEGELAQSVSSVVSVFGSETDWDGFEVINDAFTPAFLDMTTRLTFPIQTQTQMLASFGITTSVAPMLDLSDLDATDGLDTLPSEGVIDGFDTFNVRIIVPAGVELSGTDPLLDSIVVTGGMGTDSDGDGVDDSTDNCTAVANADQIDADSDGYGNLCDADFNSDCVVNVVDLGLMRSAFFSADAVIDLNSDGVVNVVDLGLLRALFFSEPGPGQGAC